MLPPHSTLAYYKTCTRHSVGPDISRRARYVPSVLSTLQLPGHVPGGRPLPFPQEAP